MANSSPSILHPKKSIVQQIQPNRDLVRMMNIFRQMVNHCIRIGIENNCSTLRRLSKLAYCELNQYDIMSSYKLNAISQACGRLSQMKQSIKRGVKTRLPYIRKPYLVNCYGFKINGMLLSIPFKSRNPINLLLNEHTQKILSDHAVKVRSFSINAFNISLCISKDVPELECISTVGIDRNLRNVTVGNNKQVTFYKTNKLLSISENTSHVSSTLKRNDSRIRKKLASKLGIRQKNRTRQLIHKISKNIVQNAKKDKSVIVFENIKGIRRLYRRGNGQGRRHRRKMNNGWSFYELQRQIHYKATWEGLPVRFVDPKRTSTICPKCGKRLQEDRENRRKLWCSNCRKIMDRDVIASLNIAYKGWLWYIHPRGDTSEAQYGTFEPAMTESRSLSNYDDLVIRIVDVSKSEL